MHTVRLASLHELRHICICKLCCHAGPIVSPMDARASTDNRDSLAKTLYSRIFDWLVAKINTAIGQDPKAQAIIGVLDIYGAAPPAVCHCRHQHACCAHAMPCTHVQMRLGAEGAVAQQQLLLLLLR